MMKKKATWISAIFFIFIFIVVFIRVVVITRVFVQDVETITPNQNSKQNKKIHPIVKKYTRKGFAQKEKKSLKRAEIKDRNGRTLAYSLTRYNVYYDGRKNLPINETSQKLIANILGIQKEKITEAMKSNKVVLLRRYATKEITKKIYNLRLPTLLTEKKLAREYPEGSLLAQTLGFVGDNGAGLTGIENTYQLLLHIKKKERWQSGEIQLFLTIDRDLQYAIEQHLAISLKKHEAKFATAIVENVKNGEILAMATAPSFDPNNFANVDPKLFFNPAISQLIEPGSVFKIFFLAKLLQDRQRKEWEEYLSKKQFFCPGYYTTKNDETVKCTDKHQEVSLQDVIRMSCNTGIIEATENYTITEMHRFLKSLMIDTKSGIDLPGESRNILPPTNEWGIRTRATIPLGQGIALTPIQLINIFSALINKGELLRPHLFKELRYYQAGKLEKKHTFGQEKIAKIITSQVSDTLVEMLSFGTLSNSTGKAAKNTGLEKVFGKTGTSQRVNLKKGVYYTTRYNAIFLGGYPKEDPQYSILILLYDPQKQHQGGRAAAPLFAKIIDDIIRIYDVKNERAVENLANTKKNNHQQTLDEILQTLEENQFEIMPHFHHLSLRQALVIIEEMKNHRKKNGKDFLYKISGDGYVSRQSPSAGEKIDENDIITIELSD